MNFWLEFVLEVVIWDGVFGTLQVKLGDNTKFMMTMPVTLKMQKDNSGNVDQQCRGREVVEGAPPWKKIAFDIKKEGFSFEDCENAG